MTIQVAAAVVGVLSLSLQVDAAHAQEQRTDDLFRVTLIGTGVPPVDPERMGPSVLVEAGGQKMLFDVGRGASLNVKRAGQELEEITAVFLTHIHGDHVLGLPDVWLSSYHFSNGGRKGRLPVYGTPGTSRMTMGLEAAYQPVAERWGVASRNPGFATTEISEAGVVFSDGELTVSAFEVPHGASPALGYRVDYQDRSVVLSGDTHYSENLIEHARGTDLLIHEVFDVPADAYPWVDELRAVHTVPEDAARVFSEVQPKLAVAFHLGPFAGSEALSRKLRTLYDGEVVAGEDLMTFVIGEEVELRSPDAASARREPR